MFQTLQLILTFAAVQPCVDLVAGEFIVSGGKANPTIQVKFNTSLELLFGG